MSFTDNSNKIPPAIISKLSDIISEHFSHSQLTIMFNLANLIEESNSGQNKLTRCSEWFRYCNENSNNPLESLGNVLAYYMERKPKDNVFPNVLDNLLKRIQNSTTNILEQYGYRYISPGKIVKITSYNGATKSLSDYIKQKNFSHLDEDFNRALINIKDDPPSSLTAACTIIETACKVFIEQNNLEMPKNKDIKHLWNTVASNLGFEAKRYADEDLKKILSGLSSIVDGIGSLRTHAGSAHGKTIMRMNIEERHARLAVHAAHTLVMFLLETWEK